VWGLDVVVGSEVMAVAWAGLQVRGHEYWQGGAGHQCGEVGEATALLAGGIFMKSRGRRLCKLKKIYLWEPF